MSVKRVKSNGLVRLPNDYGQLTEEGRRLARVNACSQWMLTDQHKSAADMVASVEAFDWLYLRDPDSLFYDLDPLPNPEFHHEVYRASYDHKFVVCAAPRGFGKSVMLRKLIMLWLTTARNFSCVYTTSTGKVLRGHFPKIMREFETNVGLCEDFGTPGSRGRKTLRPGRGMPWSLEGHIALTNGSELQGFTLDSRMRGLRPRMFVFDDPEYDPSGSTDMSNMRAEIENKLFKVIMPMIRPNDKCGILWTGTIITRRHFLQNALGVNDGGVAEDARFDYWKRLFFKAGQRMPDGSFTPLWNEMYSSDDLVLREKQMGRAAFLSEMMNEPGAGDTVLFPLDDQPHGYRVMDPDELWATQPRESKAKIVYYSKKKNGEYEKIVRIASEFLDECLVFSCSDWAETAGPSSDYQCVVTMALTPENELFVMDVWAMRAVQSVLVKAIIEASYKWLPGAVGVEAFSVYQALKHQVDTDLRQRAESSGYYPKVLAINPKHMSKTSKISGIAWRFGDEHNVEDKIKYPLTVGGMSVRNQANWAMLYDQTTDFNPAAEGGGLPHDDVLDCVSMSQLLIPGLPKGKAQAQKQDTVLDQILAGKLHDEFGESNLLKLDVLKLPPPVQKKIFAITQGRLADEEGNSRERNRI